MVEQPERIWIWFADNGNIRKWQSSAFDEGTAFVLAYLYDALAADNAELLAERDVWREKADNLAAIVGRWLALFDKHELGDAARALLDRHAAPAKGECL